MRKTRLLVLILFIPLIAIAVEKVGKKKGTPLGPT
jgi:hypothetical protein